MGTHASRAPNFPNRNHCMDDDRFAKDIEWYVQDVAATRTLAEVTNCPHGVQYYVSERIRIYSLTHHQQEMIQGDDIRRRLLLAFRNQQRYADAAGMALVHEIFEAVCDASDGDINLKSSMERELNDLITQGVDLTEREWHKLDDLFNSLEDYPHIVWRYLIKEEVMVHAHWPIYPGGKAKKSQKIGYCQVLSLHYSLNLVRVRFMTDDHEAWIEEDWVTIPDDVQLPSKNPAKPKVETAQRMSSLPSIPGQPTGDVLRYNNDGTVQRMSSLQSIPGFGGREVGLGCDEKENGKSLSSVPSIPGQPTGERECVPGAVRQNTLVSGTTPEGLPAWAGKCQRLDLNPIPSAPPLPSARPLGPGFGVPSHANLGPGFDGKPSSEESPCPEYVKFKCNNCGRKKTFLPCEGMTFEEYQRENELTTNGTSGRKCKRCAKTDWTLVEEVY